MIQVWLKNKDIKLFWKLIKTEKHILSLYSGDILTAEGIENTGIIGSMRKEFAVGKIRFWKPEDFDQTWKFVRINNNFMHPEGLILTPYCEVDVDSHLKTKRIDLRTRLERVELIGDPNEDILSRVFRTYETDVLVKKHASTDFHLLLYRTLKNI